MSIEYKNKIFESLTFDEFIQYQHEQIEVFKKMYMDKHDIDPEENPLYMKYCGWVGEFRISGF